MALKSINPFTGALIKEYRELSENEIDAKLNLATNTFSSWKAIGFDERSTLMKKVAQLLDHNKHEYAKTISLEMGKPVRDAVAEVEKCAWVCTYYAETAAQFLKSAYIETDADQSWVQYQPLGPVLAIMPWNFPFWQVFRFAAPNLMAGNVGLLKHASNVQGSAKHIEDVFLEAGFREGCFQNMPVSSQQVEAIIMHPAIKAVTLTGSEKAGSSVAAVSGKAIKKTVLELGGSNAFIVLADADIERAVQVAVKARMVNSGQSCIASKRFIVLDEVYEQFITLFKDQVEALNVGDPFDPATDIGPLARADLAEDLEKQVAASIERGAHLLTGGQRNGAIYMPTILTGVKPGMPAFDEELFGPVAAVTMVRSEDDALALANQSNYGLGMTVFTSNEQSIRKFIDGAEDGAVFINEIVKSDPRLPFGGTKQSGYGRELSIHGIREFVNAKTVYVKKDAGR